MKTKKSKFSISTGYAMRGRTCDIIIKTKSKGTNIPSCLMHALCEVVLLVLNVRYMHETLPTYHFIQYGKTYVELIEGFHLSLKIN